MAKLDSYWLGWQAAEAQESRWWVEENCGPLALEGYDAYWKKYGPSDD